MEAARYAAARKAGDFDIAAVIAGEAVDLIDDVPPAAIKQLITSVARNDGDSPTERRRKSAPGGTQGQGSWADPNPHLRIAIYDRWSAAVSPRRIAVELFPLGKLEMITLGAMTIGIVA